MKIKKILKDHFQLKDQFLYWKLIVLVMLSFKIFN